MIYQQVSELLRAKTGINSESIGSTAIERAVRARLAASGMRDAQQYLDHVSSCAIELQELIENIVVPETWFFRDREAFSALARIAHERRLAAPQRALLRALSLPCSTGEEPYSMVMALLDAGFASEWFQVDAIDISLRAIMHASEGIYGRNSFRGEHLEFRERYFATVAAGHQLHEHVREQVRLRRGNLFEMGAAAAAYDVIFCRNVLIYFDRTEQQRALQILARLLVQDGVLFVGPSETGLLLEHGFVAARMPRAFAFRKAGTVAEQPTPPPPARQRKAILPALRPATAPPPSPVVQPALPSAKLAALPLPAQEHWIATAQRLADAGNLAAALAHCEQHAKDAAPSSQGFYLMGLLHDAAGRPAQARELYRKALYLDPAHREAMVHLAVLLEGSGDSRGAQLLLERVQRINATPGK